MKNIHLIQGTFMALLLTASAVNAEEYPAANFQPKIVYRDETVVNSVPPPCVSKEVSSAKEEKPEVDARYPAANFQPKVIYSNTDS